MTAPVSIQRLATRDPDFDARFGHLLVLEERTDAAVGAAVAEIIQAVRTRGDAALLECTQRFDRVPAARMDELRVAPAELQAALDGLPAERRLALEEAARRVRRFHEYQRESSWSFEDDDGNGLGQRVLPLDRVGLYVPGGRAAYPSSVLMNALPAQVAGVRELVMVVPTPDGLRNPTVLAAACLAGVHEVWAIGGAQAVAALAWGTESIRPVDKIVGPGNAYVAEAKRRVFGQVGIDMIAGPSEILIVSDGTVPADWLAMDMFSQAEHDELAQAILLSPDARHLDDVAQAIDRLIADLPRRDIIRASLEGRGALVHVRDLAEAGALIDRVAPEHLELALADPDAMLAHFRHAGAIFLGRYASEALGDYCAGPSHVLPTMRTPRFSSPLGVYDFQKRSSLIRMSPAGADRLARLSATLARSEGLEAHARSAESRCHDPAVRPEASASNPIASGHTVPALLQALVRPEIAALRAYHVPPANGLVKLDAMENPYPLPAALQEELGARLARAAINRYPDAAASELKQVLRAAEGIPQEAGLVLGNGSDELIAMLSTLLARPGATVLTPTPGFVMYRMCATFSGMRFVGVPLDGDFQLDLPAMLEAIRQHRPALIYLAYPNNPTGACFDRDAMRAIIRAAPGLVVADEAYAPFSPDSWLQDLGRHPNLVLMRTLSKLGLAGLRIGYLVADPRLTAELEKVRPPYNLGVLNLEAGAFALSHRAVFEEQAARIRSDRAALLIALTERSARGLLRVVYPSDANFVLIRLNEGASSAGVAAAMRADGVLVKDVGGLDPTLAGCLRLTVGTAEECAQLLHALDRALTTAHV